MAVKELEPDRHFYLYAKNHYKQTDLLEDLKKIAGHYYLLEPKHIKAADLSKILLGITRKYIIKSEFSFIDFFDRLRPERDEWFYQMQGKDAPKFDYHFAVIRACLNILQMVKVRDLRPDGSYETLINLGEADENLLPFSEAHIKIQKEESNKKVENQ